MLFIINFIFIFNKSCKCRVSFFRKKKIAREYNNVCFNGKSCFFFTQPSLNAWQNAALSKQKSTAKIQLIKIEFMEFIFVFAQTRRDLTRSTQKSRRFNSLDTLFLCFLKFYPWVAEKLKITKRNAIFFGIFLLSWDLLHILKVI